MLQLAFFLAMSDIKGDVPGGPYMSAPLGGLMPNFLNLSACCIGNTLTRIISLRVSPRTVTEKRHSHGLDEFLNLLVEPTDIGIRVRRLLVHFHGFHSRVVLYRHPP